MQCDDLGPRMLDYLAGALSDDELSAIRAHLTQCETCRDEVDATAELWGELGAVTAPRPDSARMRARFDAALQGYIDGQSAPAARAGRLPLAWREQPWVQLAGAAAVLVVGVALGRFVTQPPPSNPEIARAAAGAARHAADGDAVAAPAAVRERAPEGRHLEQPDRAAGQRGGERPDRDAPPRFERQRAAGERRRLAALRRARGGAA